MWFLLLASSFGDEETMMSRMMTMIRCCWCWRGWNQESRDKRWSQLLLLLHGMRLQVIFLLEWVRICRSWAISCHTLPNNRSFPKAYHPDDYPPWRLSYPTTRRPSATKVEGRGSSASHYYAMNTKTGPEKVMLIGSRKGFRFTFFGHFMAYRSERRRLWWWSLAILQTRLLLQLLWQFPPSFRTGSKSSFFRSSEKRSFLGGEVGRDAVYSILLSLTSITPEIK